MALKSHTIPSMKWVIKNSLPKQHCPLYQTFSMSKVGNQMILLNKVPEGTHHEYARLNRPVRASAVHMAHCLEWPHLNAITNSDDSHNYVTEIKAEFQKNSPMFMQMNNTFKLRQYSSLWSRNLSIQVNDHTVTLST